MTFGVVPEGFNKKTLADIKGDIEDRQRATINPLLNLSSSSVFGQNNGIFADVVRELWDVAEAVHNGINPDSNEGAMQDFVAAITGARRLPASSSLVSLTVNIDPAVTLLVGRLVANSVTGEQFITLEAITNGGGAPADFQVLASSVLTGPIAAPAGVLTVIDTPVAGWNTVTNALDAAEGADIETPEAFRLRREQLLAASGKGTLEAVRAALLNVAGVQEAFVFENYTALTDADGVPSKAFESVVSGGAAADIAQALFDTKDLGIEPFGDLSENVTDSQGFGNAMGFSRATGKLIFIDVTVNVDASLYPVDGDAQVAAALAAWGDTLKVDDDVFFIVANCIPTAVAGVLDVPTYEHDPAPASTTSGNAETYNLVGGENLTILLDSETIRSVLLVLGDIAIPGAATAAEIAARIQTDIGAEITASDSGGSVLLVSNSGGSVLVTGGTANAELNFPTSINPASLVNIVIGIRERALFDTSRINVTSVAI